ncbi:zinc finger FYVE domain-containing protein 9 [Caerostris darwini]|uniref:Zinc finger FYVE domain-containing protein 9 n=1 Tax=Caerostris darwini TaxID=1538125 RepID=A0AAV4R026_9ARAC|nr:zinc finger FYVE domain-containing protein 9 [Caerostris darwini]
MEKYTIDIDKVLDEFEETEALKVLADKQSDDSVIEHYVAANSSTLEEQITDNSWVENKFSNTIPQVDKSITTLDHKSNSKFSLSNEDFRISGDHLTSNFYHTFDSEKNFSSSSIVSGSFTKKEGQNDDEIDSKYLTYDIFYKPCNSDSDLINTNTDYSQSVSCTPNGIPQQYALNNCSPEEILCVSVQEKSIVNTNESQIKDVSLLSTEDNICSGDFICKNSYLDTDDCNISEPNSLAEENNSLSNKESEPNSEFVENSKDLHNPYESKNEIDSKQEFSTVSQKNTELLEKLNNETNIEVKKYLIEEPKIPAFSYLKNDLHSDNSSEIESQKEEKQISDSLSESSSKQYANQIINGSNANGTEDLNDTQSHNIKSEQGNQNSLNSENNFHNIDGQANNLNLENAFSIQDDDSGVSSTEDISGNSPPEIANAESIDIVKEKWDLDGNFLNIESSCNTDIPRKFQTNENSLVSASSLQDQNDGNQSETYVDNSLSVIDINNSTQVSNVFAGARPKLDYCNNDLTKHAYQENLDLTDKSKISEMLDETKPNLSDDVKCHVENCNSKSENFVSLNDSGNNLQPLNEKVKEETQHEKSFSNVINASVTLGNTDETSLEKKAMDEEILNSSEEILNSNKDDYTSPRLQRPTTLDLPSLLTASSENSTDIDHSDSNNEALIEVDSLPQTSVEESSVSEFVPCVKPSPQIGIVKPYWIPDANALNCMHCNMKFTVIKRRHHCRGCGKVLCSRCCNQKAYLSYLNKEDRICQPCADILSSALHTDPLPAPSDSPSSSSCGSSPNFSPSPQIPSTNFGDKGMWRPHPNNPDDYCSTIPPLQQIQSSVPRPPPTVMVPIGVLKRGNKPRREPKQVIFSDGIRPGGDLTDLTEPVDTVPVYRRIGDSKQGSMPVTLHQKSRQKKIIVSDGEGLLPPIVLQTGCENDKIDWNHIFEKIQDDQQKAVSFALMKNLYLYVKLTKLDCCFGYECWCFTSHGLCNVGQDEIMIVLQRLPDERDIPRDIFKLFTHVYDSASKGSTFDDLGHIIFPEQILGSSDHRGFLFVRPTFQCLSKLTVPNTPYLVGILIHKWEVPWAKVFPLRLMLRMGAECRYYPCALVSVRHRKPVYFEIGQTIMSVLADLRNYQFTIPVIPGLVVHMEEKKTCVNIPRNRYDKVMKVLNSNNVEHVLALGSNFSTEADSHLVCMQKEEGDYQTQAINIENTTRRVTGASFIVFSGALKSTSGLSAKFSIVEDGLLIQIPQETMVNLHMALRDMKDLTIECGQINAADPEETVIVQWTRDDKKFNINVRSPIDGKSFEGVSNLRIHTSTDYAGENYLIRWTEVFFLDVDDCGSSIQNELVDPCRLAETVAQSCCMALTPYLEQLAEADLLKLGLRVTLDSQRDRVEYDIGSRNKALPALYMNALDSSLIPVILRLSGSTQSEKLSFELIFHILIK